MSDYPYFRFIPAYCPHCRRPLLGEDGGRGIDYCPGCFFTVCCACGGTLLEAQRPHD